MQTIKFHLLIKKNKGELEWIKYIAVVAIFVYMIFYSLGTGE